MLHTKYRYKSDSFSRIPWLLWGWDTSGSYCGLLAGRHIGYPSLYHSEAGVQEGGTVSPSWVWGSDTCILKPTAVFFWVWLLWRLRKRQPEVSPWCLKSLRLQLGSLYYKAKDTNEQEAREDRIISVRKPSFFLGETRFTYHSGSSGKRFTAVRGPLYLVSFWVLLEMWRATDWHLLEFFKGNNSPVNTINPK